MANIMDYLDWRGDLTFAQAPFNDVDNLLLAELSYCDFTGIVPAPNEGDGVPLYRAAEAYLSRFPEGQPIDMGVLVPDVIPDMLRKMATTQRFGLLDLNCFVNHVDAQKGEQFAALTIDTGDSALYLSFRGTDDTLAGWKEDFELACLSEIPAQKKAVAYTRQVSRQFHRKKLRLGGHSKGGNLAVYAGVFCPETVQRRIIDVWSNDGPGFHDDMLELPAHQRLESRIHSIVPKSSVVGMLLEHEENYTVVDSNQLGLMQHDGFSWQVMGSHFVTLREVTRQAHLSDLALRELVHAMPEDQRDKFVNALFDILTASGAATLTDLKADSVNAAGAMIRAMKDLDKDTRENLRKFVRLLFRSNLHLTLEGIQAEGEKKVHRHTRKKLTAEEA